MRVAQGEAMCGLDISFLFRFFFCFRVLTAPHPQDTVARVLPFWHDEIVPHIKGGKKVLIAAHGNSLRALIKYLDNMSEEVRSV